MKALLKKYLNNYSKELLKRCKLKRHTAVELLIDFINTRNNIEGYKLIRQFCDGFNAYNISAFYLFKSSEYTLANLVSAYYLFNNLQVTKLQLLLNRLVSQNIQYHYKTANFFIRVVMKFAKDSGINNEVAFKFAKTIIKEFYSITFSYQLKQKLITDHWTFISNNFKQLMLLLPSLNKNINVLSDSINSQLPTFQKTDLSKLARLNISLESPLILDNYILFRRLTDVDIKNDYQFLNTIVHDLPLRDNFKSKIMQNIYNAEAKALIKRVSNS